MQGLNQLIEGHKITQVKPGPLRQRTYFMYSTLIICLQFWHHNPRVQHSTAWAHTHVHTPLLRLFLFLSSFFMLQWIGRTKKLNTCQLRAARVCVCVCVCARAHACVYVRCFFHPRSQSWFPAWSFSCLFQSPLHKLNTDKENNGKWAGACKWTERSDWLWATLVG